MVWVILRSPQPIALSRQIMFRMPRILSLIALPMMKMHAVFVRGRVRQLGLKILMGMAWEILLLPHPIARSLGGMSLTRQTPSLIVRPMTKMLVVFARVLVLPRGIEIRIPMDLVIPLFRQPNALSPRVM